MAGPEPPFALFVLAEDIDIDYLNDALTRAWKGDFEAAWEIWLATDNYNDAPKKRDDNRIANLGTRPPIRTTFRSPFIGKAIEDCAHWLQAAPGDVVINRNYFMALVGDSREDDTMLMCRMVNTDELPYTKPEEKGQMVLQYYPIKTDDAVIEKLTGSGIKFDERLQGYQNLCKYQRRPDKSKGAPFGGTPPFRPRRGNEASRSND